MRKLTLAPIALTLLISGCATATFDPRACPVEKTYSKDEQAKLSDELKMAGPSIKAAFVDYGKLRDKARACRGVKR